MQRQGVYGTVIERCQVPAGACSLPPLCWWTLAGHPPTNQTYRPHPASAIEGGDAGSGHAAAAAAVSTTTFDFSAPGSLAAYWAHLHFISGRHGTVRAVTAADPLGRCFPFDRAPEVGIALGVLLIVCTWAVHVRVRGGVAFGCVGR